MPKANRDRLRPVMESATTDSSPGDMLRPYLFHGVDLTRRAGSSHGVGDCPFCGGQGKFSADTSNGLWRCFSCGGGAASGGGNALTFLRLLHQTALASTPEPFYQAAATDRRLCDAATVKAWGACLSPVQHSGQWLVPGYAPDGTLSQLYRRVHIKGAGGEWSWRLLPTPGVWPEGKAHALHLPNSDYDPNNRRQCIAFCEGVWDGAALWEAAQSDELGECDILAVPGCNIWRDEWTKMCDGRDVILLYDSDHPRTVALGNSGQAGTQTFRAGYDGMRRVARRLSGVARSVRYIHWGDDGYDPDRPSGYDLRDLISSDGTIDNLSFKDRKKRVKLLVSMIRSVPDEWCVSSRRVDGSGDDKDRERPKAIESMDCSRWTDCVAAWSEAMLWRQSLSDALAVMLAVCASTQQAGNQLFLDLIGSAGSGKTTLCEGLLVSNHCKLLEHLTGFFSGHKKKDDEDADCSFLARSNGKTWITPEFDVMRSSPRYAEIMSQQRRIFDGKSGATYKNRDYDMLYEGLRTPWIRAGTPAMMDCDQSQLGDRFLRLIIEDPEESEKRDIMRSALRSERAAMIETSNGTAGSIIDGKSRRAYAMTGGYVDWLRTHVEEQLQSMVVPEWCEDLCIDLAELSADLRARPNEDKRKRDKHDCKELPTRLSRQFFRLASHLAVVMNKSMIDSEVMRVVRRVALDTSHGHSLNILRWLSMPHPKMKGATYQTAGGLGSKTLEMWLSMTEERALVYLTFLRKIDVLVMHQRQGMMETWAMTQRVHELYGRVMRPLA